MAAPDDAPARTASGEATAPGEPHPAASGEPHPAAQASLLRLATAGSVDDGKSTLIGRLLHDARVIADDQLAAVERASRYRGSGAIDLSLLTDGLRAEREQGITIDVAYRYFATPRRRFIVADTPGHVQYTRNMVTGASTADAALILVDARSGAVEQTRRHLAIASLLRVPHLVIAVNKMDAVGFDQGRFDSIAGDVREAAGLLGVADLAAIPISALLGDNVVTRSTAMPWYDGPTLLDHLETIEPAQNADPGRVRFPVQWVVRGSPSTDPDYRAYAGRLESGSLRVGDRVVVLPGGRATCVASIDTFDGPLIGALASASIAIRLTDDVDLGRGGMLVDPDHVPEAAGSVSGTVCWLDRRPLRLGARLLVKHTSRTVRAFVEDVGERLDIETLAAHPARGPLAENEIGQVRLRLHEPIFSDPYEVDRATGSAILIDPATNSTAGALLIRHWSR